MKTITIKIDIDTDTLEEAIIIAKKLCGFENSGTQSINDTKLSNWRVVLPKEVSIQECPDL